MTDSFFKQMYSRTILDASWLSLERVAELCKNLFVEKKTKFISVVVGNQWRMASSNLGDMTPTYIIIVVLNW